MGASYANFDPSGKIAYIDEIDKIDDRLQVIFARFKLMGKLDKEFVRQCDAFLASMGMNEEQYQELLKKAHQIMRDDAERERTMMGSA
jgi:inorganic triphosphatase YgiF